MRDEPAGETPEAPPGGDPGRANSGEKNKKKNKVRSAWISFVGRIIAQLSGAAATIVVGLVVVSEYAAGARDWRTVADASPAVARVETRIVERDRVALAVLPLESVSPDPAIGPLANGLTEAVTVSLARFEGVHVISRTSSMQFKEGRPSLPDVAAELGVEYVVEGVVATSGDRVRVTVQLVDAVADQHLWVHDYERARGDVLALQAEVSAAVAYEVGAAIRPAIEARLAGRGRLDPKLYVRYLQGRQAADSRTGPGFQEALRHLEDAIRIDPAFALAHASLAGTYALLGLSLHGSWAPEGALALARTSATEALAVDASLAEPHAALAAVSHRLDHDWVQAGAGYRQAIALEPANALVRTWYAIFLAEQGRHREALAEAELALALNPLLPDAHSTLGFVHYYASRFDRAVEAGRRALELDPASIPARLILARSLVERGDEESAVAVCEVRSWAEGLDEMLATLADAYRLAGNRARAEEVRDELLSLESASPSAIARLHVSFGDRDAAFDAIDQAIASGSAFVTSLGVDPLFGRLRRDARFTRALERLRLR